MTAEHLGRLLVEGKYDAIQRALDEAPSVERDDLSVDMLEAAPDSVLIQAVENERGRRLLDRSFDELTSGSVGDLERKQALRVLALKAQRIPPEAFARAALDPRTKVFPVRQQGITVLKDAPLTAWRRPDGSIDVEVPVRVLQFEEARTLRGKRVHLAEDEVVCAKLYDSGGVLFCAPALFLVQLSNEADMQVLYKALEMSAWGATAGVGAMAGGGVRATVWARALAWSDRTAVVLGSLLTVVNEQRGWILERFGERGRTFLRYVDVLHSTVALYGLVRVAIAVPKLLTELHREHQQLKAARAALSAEEQAALDAVGGKTEQLLRDVEELRRGTAAGDDALALERARAARAAPQPVPAVQEEPLLATGSEGRLVPLRGEAAQRAPIASNKQGGGPNEPLAPSPPVQQGNQGAGASGPGISSAGASAPSHELAISAQLLKKGILEPQARETAMLASELGVLDDVETLVRSPGYRNPGQLRKLLRALKKGNRGHAQALQDAAERARLGHEVALEGGGADVVVRPDLRARSTYASSRARAIRS